MEHVGHLRALGATPRVEVGSDRWSVWHIVETGSTNADLMAGSSSLAHSTVLFADHQTAGRGRLDRRWEAPPGVNLLFSVLFRHGTDDPAELVRRTALAVVHAAERLGAVDVGLKWPNDVLAGERKLAGILAERADSGSLVVGVGMNIGWAPAGAARLGDGTSPVEVLGEVLDSFDRLSGDVVDEYRRRLLTLGMAVRVERISDVVTGTAVDVEADGRLVVIDTCAVTHRIDVGDVVHLRRA